MHNTTRHDTALQCTVYSTGTPTRLSAATHTSTPIPTDSRPARLSDRRGREDKQPSVGASISERPLPSGTSSADWSIYLSMKPSTERAT